MGKSPEQRFFKRTSPNGQKTHDEMPSHKGNANQNYVKISSHSY
jgi:hypothetical protein